MKIAVIGGLGYVGLHLLEHLKDTGAEVSVFARKNLSVLFDPHPGISLKSSATPGDAGAYDAVINLAYADGFSRKAVFNTNKDIVRSIKNLVRPGGLVIHTSSICVFGYLLDKPVHTGHVPFRRDYIHVESKLHIENLIRKELWNYPVQIIRCGNIWGPGSNWLHKVADRVLYRIPIPETAKAAPSNVTDVENLCRFILALTSEKQAKANVQYHHLAEFSETPWIYFIEKFSEVLGEEPVFKQIIPDYPLSLKQELKSFIQPFTPAPMIYRLLEGRKLYSWGKTIVDALPARYRSGRGVAISSHTASTDVADFVFSGQSCFITETKSDWEPPLNLEACMSRSVAWLEESGYCLVSHRK